MNYLTIYSKFIANNSCLSLLVGFFIMVFFSLLGPIIVSMSKDFEVSNGAFEARNTLEAGGVIAYNNIAAEECYGKLSSNLNGEYSRKFAEDIYYNDGDENPIYPPKSKCYSGYFDYIDEDSDRTRRLSNVYSPPVLPQDNGYLHAIANENKFDFIELLFTGDDLFTLDALKSMCLVDYTIQEECSDWESMRGVLDGVIAPSRSIAIYIALYAGHGFTRQSCDKEHETIIQNNE